VQTIIDSFVICRIVANGRRAQMKTLNSRLRTWLIRERLPAITYDDTFDNADHMVELLFDEDEGRNCSNVCMCGCVNVCVCESDFGYVTVCLSVCVCV